MLIKKKLFNVVFDRSSSLAYSSIIKNINHSSSFLSKEKKIHIDTKLNKKKLFNLDKIKKKFGISNSSIAKICNKFGLNNRIQVLKFRLRTKQKITKLVNRLTRKDSLKTRGFRFRNFSVKELRNYRGIRLSLRLPVRGQRTHTNGKTRKRLGNRRLFDLN